MNKEVYDFLCKFREFLILKTSVRFTYQFCLNSDFKVFYSHLGFDLWCFFYMNKSMSRFKHFNFPKFLRFIFELLFYKNFDIIRFTFNRSDKLNSIYFCRTIDRYGVSYPFSEILFTIFLLYPFNLIDIEIYSTPEKQEVVDWCQLCSMASKNKFFLLIIDGRYRLVGNKILRFDTGILICCFVFEIVKLDLKEIFNLYHDRFNL